MTPFTKNMDLWYAVPSAFAIDTFLKNNDIYGENFLGSPFATICWLVTYFCEAV
jgi:hypothetical protein